MFNSSFGRRGYYGIENPYFPGVQAFLAIVMFQGGYHQVNDAENPDNGGIWLMLAGALLLGVSLAYLQATRRGRFRAWSRELGELGLRGDETILDLGCARGAVTTLAAARVPDGHVVGVDRWARSRWSGSGGRRGPDDQIAKDNARAEGVEDRVQFVAGDIEELASEGNHFDVVVSGGGVGRLPSDDARRTALEEAVRVVKPGGRLLISDVRSTKRYVEHLSDLGCEDVRSHSAGPECWYGGPWSPLVFVTARKPS